jgi:hypothetical protein
MVAEPLVSRLARVEAQELAPENSPPGIIDTNIHLFDWPFRKLKYATTSALVAKLKKHRIDEAWAGSFEAVLHKNLDGANARLAAECRNCREITLRPFGSVCPIWPGWEEDLRRCHEAHQMRGIRLYPAYHQYRLDSPEFRELLQGTAARGLVVQLVVDLEDSRVHHPALQLEPVDTRPLAAALQAAPNARVQILNGNAALSQPGIGDLLATNCVTFDIANFEGSGAVGRLLAGDHWSIKTQLRSANLMFGSHTPYFPLEASLLRLFESPLELEQLTSIMNSRSRQWLLEAAAAR